MTTLAMPSSFQLPEVSFSNQEAKRVKVDPSLLSQHQSLGIPQELHFSESTFAFDDDQEVNDLLNDLGIIPLEGGIPEGEENGPNTTIFNTIMPTTQPEEELYRTVLPSLSSKNDMSIIPTQALIQPMRRSVSLEKVETFSVPNPILKEAVSTGLDNTGDNALSQNNQGKQGIKRKLSNLSSSAAEKDLTEEELVERR